ncbi:hypothetical protein NEPAR06_0709 [Nematocida parisii]|uniref:Ricin B lectin domain-containing protein n=1 Tax=Nematocida parisii (strain ERTm3) TaxID=935791 RepID=I3EHU3_NEMP3|nr:uncharacterized protein NEPG_02389 [Nematocida parisii ERTm1]EIJ88790.1 hypothetical protein NEQG_00609 [Nematocida parisii ERTm3]EIJ92698.1 hypothetical protein NEPG_02389 [Nematocida parisii ERTm1]KAI5143020.1 hypothetical protein NEPAR07_0436 [Nematocida parisii]KAI5153751.1 hypothetical protein NEPAR06_0709 [Nematocida parisii]|eukprot:XP_013060216.1 hypothetical protein NEPG_02389 [Nematocida parisii ERTm1]
MTLLAAIIIGIALNAVLHSESLIVRARIQYMQMYDSRYDKGGYYRPYDRGIYYRPYDRGGYYRPYDRGVYYKPQEPSSYNHYYSRYNEERPPDYGVSHKTKAPKMHDCRKINFYSKKINAGYLYNVGTKRFIGTDDKKYWVSAVDIHSKPLPIAIVASFGDGVGVYTEILSVDSVESPNLGNKTSTGYYENVKRIDVGGGKNNKSCYLHDRSSTYNRFSITPPYYKGGSEFKILKSPNCLGVTTDNSLIEMPCVDDTTEGEGTEENDRQLFKFCRTISSDISKC